MRTLIAYTTKTGTTSKCSDMLAEKLTSLGEVTVADIEQRQLDVSEYDLIIIGGYVRMGKLSKPSLKFMKKNKKKLLQKQSAYFFCCGYPQTADLVISNNYPYELINACICIETFGGELNTNVLSPMDKRIADMVLNSPRNTGQAKLQILENNIKLFADKIIETVG